MVKEGIYIYIEYEIKNINYRKIYRIIEINIYIYEMRSKIAYLLIYLDLY